MISRSHPNPESLRRYRSALLTCPPPSTFDALQSFLHCKRSFWNKVVITSFPVSAENAWIVSHYSQNQGGTCVHPPELSLAWLLMGPQPYLLRNVLPSLCFPVPLALFGHSLFGHSAASRSALSLPCSIFHPLCVIMPCITLSFPSDKPPWIVPTF